MQVYGLFSSQATPDIFDNLVILINLLHRVTFGLIRKPLQQKNVIRLVFLIFFSFQQNHFWFLFKKVETVVILVVSFVYLEIEDIGWLFWF